VKVYKIPETLSCVIFDIDSTLYTHHAYAREQIDVQIRHFARLRNMSFEQADSLVRDFRDEHERKFGSKISLGNALTNFGVPISESVRWRETLIEPGDYLSEDPRLEETLKNLAARYRLVAVTNNPTIPARKTLEALGVSSFFPQLIGLDTTGVSKPHERPFLIAAERAGAPVHECLSVGDRYDIDVALPLELGMGGIVVDGVEDVYDLPRTLFGSGERLSVTR